MDSDQDIVQKVLDGDGASFERIVRSYQRLVYHVVSRMLPNTADHEEICQEVFVRIYQNLSRFEFNAKLSTWVARIAYNTTLNYIDKKKADLYDDLRTQSDGDEPQEYSFSEGLWSHQEGPDEQLQAQDIRRRLDEEMGSLPPIYRTVLSLYHAEEMSYDQIAKAMNLPEGTVKSHIFRARKMLKDRLLKKYSEEELRL